MFARIGFACLAVAAVAAAGLPVSTAAFAQSAPAAAQQVPLMEVSSLYGLMQASARVKIVDVRQPEEFSQGHIQGAELIPLGTLSSAYAKLPKTGKLVVYCRSGHRSAEAVKFLIANGYSNAVSLKGGYTAWKAAGH
jgi:phage shock protein E